MTFLSRALSLPHLGIGVSTEYGAARATGALDVEALVREHSDFAQFLEIGVEVHKGFDDDARRWLASGRPCTYHFLDINLDDYGTHGDDAWLAALKPLVDFAKPAWLCGDAGLWHIGERDRAHMLLLPPILTDDSASALARGVARLREHTGKDVLPENPPGTAFVGDLHLLDFFARVCERADTGMLLDVAHLAMYQHMKGNDPLDGLSAFPCERIVEVHVAGATVRDVDGLSVIDDTHTVNVLDDTWAIFEYVCARAENLKAVIFECERNTNNDVRAGFERIARTWQR